jgi:hypothetical protein
MYKLDWLRPGWIPQTKTYQNHKAASTAYAVACGIDSILAVRLSVLRPEGWVAVARCFRSQVSRSLAA